MQTLIMAYLCYPHILSHEVCATDNEVTSEMDELV